MRVPINDLRLLAEKRGLTHVIVWACDGSNVQHVATYGRNLEQCSQAADFGNKLKEALGWPESLQAQPARVRKLQARIKELESHAIAGHCEKGK